MTKADMQQRVVPAAGTKRPETTAPISVFAAGQAAQPRRSYTRTTLDVTAVQIQKAMPIPSTGAPQRGSPYVELLQRMQPSDSVQLTRRQAASLRAAAKKAGIEVVVRRLGPDAAGVWRV